MRQLLLAVVLLLTAPLSLLGQGGAVNYDDYRTNFIMIEQQNRLSEEMQSYNFFMPLSGYPQTFESMSAFNFSFVRYQRRGYDYRMRRESVNGIDLGDPISGNLYWNTLTAISNAPNVRITTEGLAPTATLIDAMGGVREYVVGADALPSESRAGLIFTDRRFRGGGRFSISSGLLDNGWAFSIAGSYRAGHDNHIKGAFANNYTFYASVAKQLGRRNTLSVSFLDARHEQSSRGAITREAASLVDNLYNPYWGFQGGKMRSSRVRKSSQPLGIATWTTIPTDKLQITTSLSYMSSENCYSSLDWYDAPNPTPDYYRYMPDFFVNESVGGIVRDMWKSGDTKVTQIDWDELYYVNRRSDGAANYVLSSDVTQDLNFQAVSVVNYKISELNSLDGGIRLRSNRMSNFNRLDDLLGGSYLRDIDPYLVDDEYNGDKLENDLRNPDREVKQSEHFGYNYDLNYSSAQVWALAKMGMKLNSKGYLNGYLGIDLSQSSIYRTGHYEKELFAGALSYGESARSYFTNYMIKAGLSYRPTPAHEVNLNMAFGNEAPLADHIFVSPYYQNQTFSKLESMKKMGGEVTYIGDFNSVDLMLSAYVSYTSGGNDVRHYYDDLSSDYSNMILRDVDKLYSGIELGAALRITSQLSFRLATAFNYNVFMSDPKADIFADSDSHTIVEGARSFMKGYRLSGTPQRVASGELQYKSSNLWIASLALNYVGDNYVSINPVRGMRRVCDNATSAENLAALTHQERLGDAMTLNLFVCKSFTIGSHFITISASVNNLADIRDVVQSGYEPMRLTKSGSGLNSTISPMPSRYYYAYGRTYYMTLNFRF